MLLSVTRLKCVCYESYLFASINLKYWEPTGDFQYIRTSIDGITEEISPFGSIPTAFW